MDDNGGAEHLWGDVNCFAMESNSNWSAWPASEGANGVDPCNGDPYPDDVDSWLIFGPFDLSDALSASLDFYFRIESESCCDFLRVMASTDSVNYNGFQISGTHDTGPSFDTVTATFGVNGYNFMSFDLTNVPTSGDLTGQSSVWIAFQFESDGSINGVGPFIDRVLLRKNSSPRIAITDENFEIVEFPNANWQSFAFSSVDARWDDVFEFSSANCPAQSGSWAMWPADEGVDGFNPCTGNPYPNDMNAWLIHGPFSLVGAEEAWVDFNYRLLGEPGFDRFWWAVATDDINYWGFNTSMDAIDGPFNNGYNAIRFNLGNVPTLGDLRGEDKVWLAFIFESDFSNNNQGPFLDDVRVIVERSIANTTYLPILTKSEILQTNLSIQNNTTGAATYTIKNPTLNGSPIADIVCNIAQGQKVFCGTFDAGTYTVMSSSPCGTGEGSRTFPPGNYDLDPPLHCL